MVTFPSFFTARKILVCVAVSALAVILFGLNIPSLMPTIANHLGFALPGGVDGLPYHINYMNRHYNSSYVCSGESWCKELHHDPCENQQELQKRHAWPLIQVGTVPSFQFGASYPILASESGYRQVQGKVYVLYVRAANNCYVSYTLSGSW